MMFPYRRRLVDAATTAVPTFVVTTTTARSKRCSLVVRSRRVAAEEAQRRRCPATRRRRQQQQQQRRGRRIVHATSSATKTIMGHDGNIGGEELPSCYDAAMTTSYATAAAAVIGLNNGRRRIADTGFRCQRRWRSDLNKSDGVGVASDKNDNHEGSDTEDHDHDVHDDDVVVYESPMGKLVTRLRAVSLSTAVIGTVGLPVAIAAKGGDLPSTGILAMGISFCAVTVTSTAAIHFVFSPYVYAVERIPVRRCRHEKKKTAGESLADVSGDGDAAPDATDSSTAAPSADDGVRDGVPCGNPNERKERIQSVLYKAVCRSLFLRPVETVFDPATDLGLYKGFRPVCNLTAKGKPLYVHKECVYDDVLRHHIQQLSEKGNAIEPAESHKENPDDFL